MIVLPIFWQLRASAGVDAIAISPEMAIAATYIFIANFLSLMANEALPSRLTFDIRGDVVVPLDGRVRVDNDTLYRLAHANGLNLPMGQSREFYLSNLCLPRVRIDEVLKACRNFHLQSLSSSQREDMENFQNL